MTAMHKIAQAMVTVWIGITTTYVFVILGLLVQTVKVSIICSCVLPDMSIIKPLDTNRIHNVHNNITNIIYRFHVD